MTNNTPREVLNNVLQDVLRSEAFAILVNEKLGRYTDDEKVYVESLGRPLRLVRPKDDGNGEHILVEIDTTAMVNSVLGTGPRSDAERVQADRDEHLRKRAEEGNLTRAEELEIEARWAALYGAPDGGSPAPAPKGDGSGAWKALCARVGVKS